MQTDQAEKLAMILLMSQGNSHIGLGELARATTLVQQQAHHVALMKAGAKKSAASGVGKELADAMAEGEKRRRFTRQKLAGE